MTHETQRDHWFLGTRMRMLVTAEDSAGAFSIIEQTAPRGFSPPMHVHARETTVLYVLEGEVEVQRGDERLVAGPAESVVLPPTVPHSFRILSESARLLEVNTPGGFEQFFIDQGRPATTEGLPAPEAPNPAALAAGSAPYGVEIIGPPLGM